VTRPSSAGQALRVLIRLAPIQEGILS
jgi:hypothetical protein